MAYEHESRFIWNIQLKLSVQRPSFWVFRTRTGRRSERFVKQGVCNARRCAAPAAGVTAGGSEPQPPLPTALARSAPCEREPCRARAPWLCPAAAVISHLISWLQGKLHIGRDEEKSTYPLVNKGPLWYPCLNVDCSSCLGKETCSVLPCCPRVYALFNTYSCFLPAVVFVHTPETVQTCPETKLTSLCTPQGIGSSLSFSTFARAKATAAIQFCRFALNHFRC